MNIVLLYNLRSEFARRQNSPLDADADWDDRETISCIQNGVLGAGAECLDAGHPANFFSSSRDPGTVVLSICEMTGSSYREAIVPTLCEFFGIPYFFSPPESLHITLDKNLANLVAQQAGMPVPNWRAVCSAAEYKDFSSDDVFPCIVKPAAEGSGMGINGNSIFHDANGIAERVAEIVSAYGGKAIIQNFLQGREFTVGVLERNGVPVPLCPIEVRPHAARSIRSFVYCSQAKAEHETCEFVPLEEGSLRTQLECLAVKAHRVFGCRDVSRSDFRLDPAGFPFFLEINPLPHFHPDYGDFCRSAFAAGVSYDDLWKTIVTNVSRRITRGSL